MEHIEFVYCFKDSYGNAASKEVKIANSSEEGLTYSEVCEMFVDFMETAGYNLETVYSYFKE